MLICSQSQNKNACKLTIFKPPYFIYKLTKHQPKLSQNLNYDIYYNKEFSLRKYTNTKLNLSDLNQISLYQWRKNQNYPIPKVIYIQLLQQNLSSSAISQNNNSTIAVNIYVEHIQKILGDMINLNLNESIYVLKQCLLAFQSLLQKFSAVSINKFQIGLNAQGKLKVWINQNLALNDLEKKSNECQSSHNQILIVQTAVVYFLIVIVNSFIMVFKNNYHQKDLLSTTACSISITLFLTLITSLFLKIYHTCYLKKHHFVQKNPMLDLHLIMQIKMKNTLPETENFHKIQVLLTQTRLNILDLQLEKIIDKKLIVLNLEIIQQRVQRQTQKGIAKIFLSMFIKQRLQRQKIKNNSHNQFQTQKSRRNQTKVSLQVIIQKTRKTSIKSNCMDISKKSNISINKQRPSISVVPSFINKSAKKLKNQINQNQNEIRSSLDQAQNREKSNSLVSSKSRDYYSLINSKMTSSKNASQVVENWKTRQNLYKTDTNKYKNCGQIHHGKLIQQQNQLFYLNKKQTGKTTNFLNLNTPMNVNRSRSASATIKLGSYKLQINAFNTKNKQMCTSELKTKDNKNSKNKKEQSLQKKGTSSKISSQRNNNHTDKASDNEKSNDFENTRNKSFLTKTNYDSVTEDNQRNSSLNRMNFSSMSIQYKMANKNLDLFQMGTNQKYDVKRSLMSFKCGFQKILQNPSCKQVEQENQSKSYNGSSLKNTQNIEQVLQKNVFHQNIRRNSKKQDQTSLSYSNSNNYSFGNASNKGIARKIGLKDSIDQNWDQIKQTNDLLLIKNQWKKTINNLQNLQNLELNQSIVDVCGDSIIQNANANNKYSQIRLDKLDRLGRNMVYSIIKKDFQ